jgi:hypothetical protein
LVTGSFIRADHYGENVDGRVVAQRSRLDTFHELLFLLTIMNRSLLPDLVLPGAIWIGILCVEQFDWGRGDVKAIALLLLLLGTVALTLRARRTCRMDGKEWNEPLLMTCVVLLAGHLAYLIEQLTSPSIFDGATMTLDAARALLSGLNPYVLPLDTVAFKYLGDPTLAGFKYLPLTALAYLPLGVGLEDRGVLLTNMVLHAATVLLIYRLARRLGTRNGALLAVLFYLSLPIVIRQSLGRGAIDLVAVPPMLAALLASTGRPGLAGFWVGLSISAKLLPGLLLLPCVFPGAGGRRSYLIGLAVGLLPVVAFAILSPAAFYYNIIVFNLVRPTDTTSWLSFVPGQAGTAMQVILAAALLSLSAFTWRSAPDLLTRCGLLCAMIILTILGAPTAHHNYQLWWLPLISVLVGLAATREIKQETKSRSPEFVIEPGFIGRWNSSRIRE